jgi:hypothetical protein
VQWMLAYYQTSSNWLLYSEILKDLSNGGHNMIDIQKWGNGYLVISSSKQLIGNRVIWWLQLMVNLFGNFWILIQMCLVLQIVILYFKYGFHGW